MSYLQSVALLSLRVTPLGSQAEGGTAWACLHPHIGFPTQGQWEPLSHLKEVLGLKQEVALGAETPWRISPGPWGGGPWATVCDGGKPNGM